MSGSASAGRARASQLGELAQRLRQRGQLLPETTSPCSRAARASEASAVAREDEPSQRVSLPSASGSAVQARGLLRSRVVARFRQGRWRCGFPLRSRPADCRVPIRQGRHGDSRFRLGPGRRWRPPDPAERCPNATIWRSPRAGYRRDGTGQGSMLVPMRVAISGRRSPTSLGSMFLLLLHSSNNPSPLLGRPPCPQPAAPPRSRPPVATAPAPRPGDRGGRARASRNALERGLPPWSIWCSRTRCRTRSRR